MSYLARDRPDKLAPPAQIHEEVVFLVRFCTYHLHMDTERSVQIGHYWGCADTFSLPIIPAKFKALCVTHDVPVYMRNKIMRLAPRGKPLVSANIDIAEFMHQYAAGGVRHISCLDLSSAHELMTQTQAELTRKDSTAVSRPAEPAATRTPAATYAP